jgi:glycosyltransferase involved in cell wall biosynthesis
MTTDTVGGVWTYALDLARALAGYGSQVTLAAVGAPPDPGQRNDALSIPHLELQTFEGKLEWMDEPWDDVARSGQWLLDLESDIRPDIVHLNSYAHGSLPFAAPTLLVGHSCVLSWWRAVKGEDAPSKYEPYRSLVRTGLTEVACAVTVSRWMSAQLTELYRLPSNPVVIENGRTLPYLQPVRKKSVAFSCGRLWDEGKNIRLLDTAAALTTVPVYIAGEDRGASFGKAKPLGRLNSEQVGKWLMSSAVYAHPALYEPFGLAVLEAALCGCALLLADIPPLRELWGDAALFVDPHTPSAWATALELLQENEQLRSRLGTHAHEVARKRTAERMVHRYLHAYARASAGKAAVA